MKILIASHVFYPSLGGIETVTAVLAEAFVERGHEVRLVTQTPSDEADDYPFEVLRSPSTNQLRALAKDSDVFWQNNVSLKTLLPLSWGGFKKPIFVTHQTWLNRTDGSTGWQDVLKKMATGRVKNIAISAAIAEQFKHPCTIIGNPYDSHLFQQKPEVERDRDIVFLGRLVSDKGADVLLDALALLKETSGSQPSVSIIGEGPERSKLEKQAEGLSVSFLGAQRGNDLVNRLNRHRIMVVPSRWKEPFGIVALEGIAAGCLVIASAGGGLPDAVGDCGVTFPNENAQNLAEQLSRFLNEPSEIAAYTCNRSKHLEQFTVFTIADRYLSLFSDAL